MQDSSFPFPYLHLLSFSCPSLDDRYSEWDEVDSQVLISISLKAKTGEKVKHLLAMCISFSDKCLLFIGPVIDWMIWYFWCLHFGIALSLALIFCMIRSWQRSFPFCRLPFHSVLLLCRSFISPCDPVYNYSDCYAIVFFGKLLSTPRT